MTLCLAQSLIDKPTFDLHDQVSKYISWWKTGYLSSTSYCFDIGNLTLQTLSFWQKHFSDHESATKTQNEDQPQTQDDINIVMTRGQQLLNKSHKRKIFSGNGSSMRTVPIGLYFYDSGVDKIREYATLASDVTHPYPANAEACMVYCILVASCLSPSSSPTKESLFAIFKSFTFSDVDLNLRFKVYEELGDFAGKEVEKISSSGWVVNSLEAALWAFFTSNGFEDGAVKVVNLGDDADTVGAIYGGLAGAFYGLDAIPQVWREGLMQGEVVEKVADGLYNVIKARNP